LILDNRAGLSSESAKHEARELLSNFGLAADPLLNWTPTSADVHVIEHTNNALKNIVGGCMTNQSEEAALALSFLSEPEPPWPTLKKVASSYLQSNRIPVTPLDPFRPINVAGRPTFAIGSSVLTIYIDESYGALLSEHSQKAIIGGIVWIGDAVSWKSLPEIENHLGSEATHDFNDYFRRTNLHMRPFPRLIRAKRAYANVMGHKRCFPFILKIEVDKANGSARQQHELLLQKGVALLLGWLLPKPKQRISVSIVMEEEGEKKAGSEFTQALQAALRAEADSNPSRFCYWNLKKAWFEAKSSFHPDEHAACSSRRPDEVTMDSARHTYLAYADLLAYVGWLETFVSRSIAAIADFTQLPGYADLTLDLFLTLHELDNIEVTGNVASILDCGIHLGRGPLREKLIQELRPRLASRPDLQFAILNKLDERFRAKHRNLEKLQKQLEFARAVIPLGPSSVGTRLRLLWAAVELQDANHAGDPVRANRLASTYEADWASTKRADPPLVLWTDLNLAVHYADRFDFAKAKSLLERWLAQGIDTFNADLRGRLWSSMGQVKAMLSDSQEAEDCFKRALDEFELLDPPDRVAERDQTACYRAINSMDSGSTVVAQHLSDVLGPIDMAVDRLASNDDPVEAFHHHLLLRYLYLQDGPENRKKYPSAVTQNRPLMVT
jgi:hypothetical protein